MQRRTGRSSSVGPASRGETGHRFLIHDRDAIYAPVVERAIRSMGLRVLKTPVQTPQANGFCERLIGTIRRECLDWLIPLHQPHLRQLLTALAKDAPHPRLVAPPTLGPVVANPQVGGLHHRYDRRAA
jgi:putative transposase